MITKLHNHEASSWCCAGAFGLGVALLLVGSLIITHSEMGSGLRTAGALTCFGGTLIIAGAFSVTALKIDSYYRNKKEAQAPYIPPEATDWEAVYKANRTIPVASPSVKNYDPVVRQNANFGDRRNRKNNGESNSLHDQL